MADTECDITVLEQKGFTVLVCEPQTVSLLGIGT